MNGEVCAPGGRVNFGTGMEVGTEFGVLQKSDDGGAETEGRAVHAEGSGLRGDEALCVLVPCQDGWGVGEIEYQDKNLQ